MNYSFLDSREARQTNKINTHFGIRQTWIHNTALPPISCVILVKTFMMCIYED